MSVATQAKIHAGQGVEPLDIIPAAQMEVMPDVKQVMRWVWKKPDGRPYMLTQRIEKKVNGAIEKKVLPISWCSLPEGGEGWGWKGAKTGARWPLHADILESGKDCPVIICEGEKSADAAAILFPEYIAICWCGGAEAVKHTKWAQLYKREVLLFPDFDAQSDDAGQLKHVTEQPSYRAMQWLGTHLHEHGAKVSLVGYIPGEKEHGWDAADALKEGMGENSIAEFCAARLVHPWKDNRHYGESAAVQVKPKAEEKANPLAKPHDMMDAREWMHPPVRGQVPQTLENFIKFLEHYNITTKYDEITRENLRHIPGVDLDSADYLNVSWTAIESLLVRNGINQTERFMRYLNKVAKINTFNPVVDWVKSKPWDGVDRLPDLLATVEVAPASAELWPLYLRKWMMSAWNCVSQGKANHIVLVFQGAQRIGKTSWVQRLIPDTMEHLVKAGLSVNAEDSTSVRKVTSCFIAELGELESTLRRDMASLKAFLTSDWDEFRVQYKAEIERHRRRTSYFASVNSEDFLVDPTGNERFAVVNVLKVEYQHTIDMQQVWAQVAHLVDVKKEQHWLSMDEYKVMSEGNRQFVGISPMRELLEVAYAWDAEPYMWSKRNGTQLLLELGFDRPTTVQRKEIGYALRDLNVDKMKSHGAMVYMMPPKA